MRHECHHRRARPSPGGVGRMESGDRAVSVQGGMARSTQARQGQETQLCSTDGKDKTTRRDGAKKPQLEAAPGSWVEPQNLGPAESPSPHRWLCVVPISADSLILAQVDMPHARCRHSPGPLGSPCDCLGAWMVDSAPTGPAWALPSVAADQSTEAPEVKELGGGGPAEPPATPTWSQRRVSGPTVGPASQDSHGAA